MKFFNEFINESLSPIMLSLLVDEFMNAYELTTSEHDIDLAIRTLQNKSDKHFDDSKLRSVYSAWLNNTNGERIKIESNRDVLRQEEQIRQFIYKYYR